MTYTFSFRPSQSLRPRWKHIFVFSAGVLFSAVAQNVVASGPTWSKEIAIDPGVRVPLRAFSMERAEFSLSGDHLVGTMSGGGTAAAFEVLPSGESDGQVRAFLGMREGFRVQVLQVHRDGPSWTTIEVPEAGGLQVSRFGVSEDPEKTIVLGADVVDRESVRLEATDSGYWITWRTQAGSVHSVDVSIDLEIRSTEILATEAERLDVELGTDGGVVGWVEDGEIIYRITNQSGEPVFSARNGGQTTASFDHEFAVARINNRICCISRVDFENYELRSYDLEDGELVSQAGVGSLDSNLWLGRAELTSGSSGALFLTQSLNALLLDSEGAPQGDVFRIGDRSIRDSFDETDAVSAVWREDHYLVGWTHMQSQTGADPSGGRECYVTNPFHSRRVSPEGDLGALESISNVYQPASAQPWFDGTDLNAILRDKDSNRSYQVRIDEDDTYEMIRPIGHGRECDYPVRTGTGAVVDGTYYGCRLERSDGLYGTTYRHSYLDVVGPTPAPRYAPFPLGDVWSLDVIWGAPWVVTGGDVYRIGEPRTATTLTPTPTRETSKLMGIGGDAFVAWQDGDRLLGGFTFGGGQPIEPEELVVAPGLFIQDVAGAEDAGLILYSTRTTPKGLWAITVSNRGVASEPQLLDSVRTWNSHVIWDDEQFVAAWAPSSPSHELRLGRISAQGELLDESPVAIPTEVVSPYGPRLAVIVPGTLAVTYGGNRFRRLFMNEVELPPKAGISLRSREDGVEVDWYLQEGDLGSSLERATVFSAEEVSYETIYSSEGPGETGRYLDTDVEPGFFYSYRVRIVGPTGDARVLLAIEHRWRQSETGGSEARVTLFPNPASGRLSLLLSASVESPTQLWIVDSGGRVREKLPSSAVDQLSRVRQLDLSPWVEDLPSGVYWLRSDRRSFPAKAIRIVH